MVKFSLLQILRRGKLKVLLNISLNGKDGQTNTTPGKLKKIFWIRPSLKTLKKRPRKIEIHLSPKQCQRKESPRSLLKLVTLRNLAEKIPRKKWEQISLLGSTA